jgi:serine/threonine protein kinase
MSELKSSVGNSYKLIKSLGKGSFGDVYLVTDREKNEFACKAEHSGAKNRLKGESLIYKRFEMKKLDCVPRVYKYLATPEYNLLIMQLLGKSLDVVMEDQCGKLDIGTVMKIAISLIGNIEKIHRVGIIHRDIKPNNFMFGRDKDQSKLFVMDFGLSKKWYIDRTHIDYTTDRSMIGTARYASLNIHNGIEPSRRDDMESIGYMLVYLVVGSLPWQGLKKKTKENPLEDKIGDKKLMVDLKTLCAGLPDCFYEYINYTRNLQFTEKPDYEYLRELFTNSAQKNNIILKYFWEPNCQDNDETCTQDNKLIVEPPRNNNNNTHGSRKKLKQDVLKEPVEITKNEIDCDQPANLHKSQKCIKSPVMNRKTSTTDNKIIKSKKIPKA